MTVVGRVLVVVGVVAAGFFGFARSEPVSEGSGASARGGEASSVLGVFEGRTPCGEVAVRFTGFGGPGCEKIKWRLTLRHDSATHAPTTYLYEGTRTSREGPWVIARGSAADPDAVVYRLDPDHPQSSLSLLRADESVLLLLDDDLHVLVGDASWSYVLNRTDSGSEAPTAGSGSHSMAAMLPKSASSRPDSFLYPERPTMR